MDRTWIDSRDRTCASLGPGTGRRGCHRSPWVYHPADPGTTEEILSADLWGYEDLDTMTDQELMALIDEATP